MIKFLIGKLGYGILVLLGVIIAIFFLFNILPGDPARMMLGQRADSASVANVRKELGTDQPLLVQFAAYLSDLSPVSLHYNDRKSPFWFNQEKYGPPLLHVASQNFMLVVKWPYLRRSYQSRRDVSEILAESFINTVILALVAMAFALIVGVGLGILCALHKNSFLDRLSLVFSVLGMSLPSFFAAILIAWLFAFILGSFTHLNMTGSLYSVDDLGRGEYIDLRNLILPAITLGLRPLAIIVELTRNSLLEVLSQDYIRTARAQGLRWRKIIMKHALVNALNPVITAATGWLASLLAGAVFVEYIFDWKGIGLVIVNALDKYDFPVIMGAVLFISVNLVIINILADVLYGVIDPRVRKG
jgi:peptide/nickel transport system permease protein